MELDHDDVRILLDFFEELSHVEIHWTKSRMVAAEEAVARLRRALNDDSLPDSEDPHIIPSGNGSEVLQYDGLGGGDV